MVDSRSSRSQRLGTEKKAVAKPQAAYRQRRPLLNIAAVIDALPFRLMFRWWWGFFLALVLLGVMGSVLWLYPLRVQTVDIKVLSVDGQPGALKHISRTSLQSRLAPLTQGSMWQLDVLQIQYILQQMPWIYSAHVQRHWPNTLSIQLREQQAVAYWHALEGTLSKTGLLNAQGELFEPAVTQMPDAVLPHLQGLPGYEAEVLAQYRVLQKSLEDKELSLQKVQLDARQQWLVELSRPQQATAFSVTLGQQPFATAWQGFLHLYQHHLHSSLATLHSVDLRYNNGIAVQYKRK